jgi:hypothetical protein
VTVLLLARVCSQLLAAAIALALAGFAGAL